MIYSLVKYFYIHVLVRPVNGSPFSRFSIEEEEARRFMRHIVSAVDHIHNTGVVHRYFRVTGTSKEEENRYKGSGFSGS